MSLLHIRAKIACDACGKAFEIEIDPAAKADTGFEMVEEGLRAGFALSGGCCSLDEGRMRCPDCTSLEDAAWIRSHPKYISGVSEDAEGWVVTTYDETVYRLPPGDRPEFDKPVSRYGVDA